MSQSEQRKKDNERMRMSGYDENYRYRIIKSGFEGFDKMLQKGKKMRVFRSTNQEPMKKIKGLMRFCYLI